MPDLVVGIREHEGHRSEAIARAQSGREPLEQRAERIGLEQLHLAPLRALPSVFVLTRLVRERGYAPAQIYQLAVVSVHARTSFCRP